MEKVVYKIIGAFIFHKEKMLIVRMSGAACVITEDEYNRIIIAERKYRQRKIKKVA